MHRRAPQYDDRLSQSFLNQQHHQNNGGIIGVSSCGSLAGGVGSVSGSGRSVSSVVATGGGGSLFNGGNSNINMMPDSSGGEHHSVNLFGLFPNSTQHLHQLHPPNQQDEPNQAFPDVLPPSSHPEPPYVPRPPQHPPHHSHQSQHPPQHRQQHARSHRGHHDDRRHYSHSNGNENHLHDHQNHPQPNFLPLPHLIAAQQHISNFSDPSSCVPSSSNDYESRCGGVGVDICGNVGISIGIDGGSGVSLSVDGDRSSYPPPPPPPTSPSSAPLSSAASSSLSVVPPTSQNFEQDQSRNQDQCHKNSQTQQLHHYNNQQQHPRHSQKSGRACFSNSALSSSSPSNSPSSLSILSSSSVTLTSLSSSLDTSSQYLSNQSSMSAVPTNTHGRQINNILSSMSHVKTSVTGNIKDVSGGCISMSCNTAVGNVGEIFPPLPSSSLPAADRRDMGDGPGFVYGGVVRDVGGSNIGKSHWQGNTEGSVVRLLDRQHQLHPQQATQQSHEKHQQYCQQHSSQFSYPDLSVGGGVAVPLPPSTAQPPPPPPPSQSSSSASPSSSSSSTNSPSSSSSPSAGLLQQSSQHHQQNMSNQTNRRSLPPPAHIQLQPGGRWDAVAPSSVSSFPVNSSNALSDGHTTGCTIGRLTSSQSIRARDRDTPLSSSSGSLPLLPSSSSPPLSSSLPMSSPPPLPSSLPLSSSSPSSSSSIPSSSVLAPNAPTGVTLIPASSEPINLSPAISLRANRAGPGGCGDTDHSGLSSCVGSSDGDGTLQYTQLHSSKYSSQSSASTQSDPITLYHRQQQRQQYQRQQHQYQSHQPNQQLPNQQSVHERTSRASLQQQPIHSHPIPSTSDLLPLDEKSQRLNHQQSIPVLLKPPQQQHHHHQFHRHHPLQQQNQHQQTQQHLPLEDSSTSKVTSKGIGGPLSVGTGIDEDNLSSVAHVVDISDCDRASGGDRNSSGDRNSVADRVSGSDRGSAGDRASSSSRGNGGGSACSGGGRSGSGSGTSGVSDCCGSSGIGACEGNALGHQNNPTNFLFDQKWNRRGSSGGSAGPGVGVGIADSSGEGGSPSQPSKRSATIVKESSEGGKKGMMNAANVSFMVSSSSSATSCASSTSKYPSSSSASSTGKNGGSGEGSGNHSNGKDKGSINNSNDNNSGVMSSSSVIAPAEAPAELQGKGIEIDVDAILPKFSACCEESRDPRRRSAACSDRSRQSCTGSGGVGGLPGSSGLSGVCNGSGNDPSKVAYKALDVYIIPSKEKEREKDREQKRWNKKGYRKHRSLIDGSGEVDEFDDYFADDSDDGYKYDDNLYSLVSPYPYFLEDLEDPLMRISKTVGSTRQTAREFIRHQGGLWKSPMDTLDKWLLLPRIPLEEEIWVEGTTQLLLLGLPSQMSSSRAYDLIFELMVSCRGDSGGRCHFEDDFASADDDTDDSVDEGMGNHFSDDRDGRDKCGISGIPDRSSITSNENPLDRNNHQQSKTHQKEVKKKDEGPSKMDLLDEAFADHGRSFAVPTVIPSTPAKNNSATTTTAQLMNHLSSSLLLAASSNSGGDGSGGMGSSGGIADDGMSASIPLILSSKSLAKRYSSRVSGLLTSPGLKYHSHNKRMERGRDTSGDKSSDKFSAGDVRSKTGRHSHHLEKNLHLHRRLHHQKQQLTSTGNFSRGKATRGTTGIGNKAGLRCLGVTDVQLMRGNYQRSVVTQAGVLQRSLQTACHRRLLEQHQKEVKKRLPSITSLTLSVKRERTPGTAWMPTTDIDSEVESGTQNLLYRKPYEKKSMEVDGKVGYERYDSSLRDQSGEEIDVEAKKLEGDTDREMNRIKIEERICLAGLRQDVKRHYGDSIMTSIKTGTDGGSSGGSESSASVTSTMAMVKFESEEAARKFWIVFSGGVRQAFGYTIKAVPDPMGFRAFVEALVGSFDVTSMEEDETRNRFQQSAQQQLEGCDVMANVGTGGGEGGISKTPQIFSTRRSPGNASSSSLSRPSQSQGVTATSGAAMVHSDRKSSTISPASTASRVSSNVGHSWQNQALAAVAAVQAALDTPTLLGFSGNKKNTSVDESHIKSGGGRGTSSAAREGISTSEGRGSDGGGARCHSDAGGQVDGKKQNDRSSGPTSSPSSLSTFGPSTLNKIGSGPPIIAFCPIAVEEHVPVLQSALSDLQQELNDANGKGKTTIMAMTTTKTSAHDSHPSLFVGEKDIQLGKVNQYRRRFAAEWDETLGGVLMEFPSLHIIDRLAVHRRFFFTPTGFIVTALLVRLSPSNPHLLPLVVEGPLSLSSNLLMLGGFFDWLNHEPLTTDETPLKECHLSEVPGGGATPDSVASVRSNAVGDGGNKGASFSQQASTSFSSTPNDTPKRKAGDELENSALSSTTQSLDGAGKSTTTAFSALSSASAAAPPIGQGGSSSSSSPSSPPLIRIATSAHPQRLGTTAAAKSAVRRPRPLLNNDSAPSFVYSSVSPSASSSPTATSRGSNNPTNSAVKDGPSPAPLDGTSLSVGGVAESGNNLCTSSTTSGGVGLGVNSGDGVDGSSTSLGEGTVKSRITRPANAPGSRGMKTANFSPSSDRKVGDNTGSVEDGGPGNGVVASTKVRRRNDTAAGERQKKDDVEDEDSDGSSVSGSGSGSDSDDDDSSGSESNSSSDDDSDDDDDEDDDDDVTESTGKKEDKVDKNRGSKFARVKRRLIDDDDDDEDYVEGAGDGRTKGRGSSGAKVSHGGSTAKNDSSSRKGGRDEGKGAAKKHDERDRERTAGNEFNKGVTKGGKRKKRDEREGLCDPRTEGKEEREESEAKNLERTAQLRQSRRLRSNTTSVSVDTAAMESEAGIMGIGSVRDGGDESVSWVAAVPLTSGGSHGDTTGNSSDGLPLTPIKESRMRYRGAVIDSPVVQEKGGVMKISAPFPSTHTPSESSMYTATEQAAFPGLKSDTVDKSGYDYGGATCTTGCSAAVTSVNTARDDAAGNSVSSSSDKQKGGVGKRKRGRPPNDRTYRPASTGQEGKPASDKPRGKEQQSRPSYTSCGSNIEGMQVGLLTDRKVAQTSVAALNEGPPMQVSGEATAIGELLQEANQDTGDRTVDHSPKTARGGVKYQKGGSRRRGKSAGDMAQHYNQDSTTQSIREQLGGAFAASDITSSASFGIAPRRSGRLQGGEFSGPLLELNPLKRPKRSHSTEIFGSGVVTPEIFPSATVPSGAVTSLSSSSHSDNLSTIALPPRSSAAQSEVSSPSLSARLISSGPSSSSLTYPPSHLAGGIQKSMSQISGDDAASANSILSDPLLHQQTQSQYCHSAPDGHHASPSVPLMVPSPAVDFSSSLASASSLSLASLPPRPFRLNLNPQHKLEALDSINNEGSGVDGG